MNWIYALLLAAAAYLLFRVAMIIRRVRAARQDDWDARMVRDLRASGANAFTPYEVDFFFTLPNEQACTSVRQRLESEGFSTEARGVDNAEAPDNDSYSLHASKRLRISASDMHEYSQRFEALATQFGGHYDGWTTDPSRP
ncbi:MAG TPA: ribonuclease E inhibitor RraB [Steroidobacteraceae bacterium]|nr:ribonuclease E inhibitor RraB [Steroidobacteraceae bacterium]